MPRNGRPFSASRIVPRSELPSRKVFRIPLFSACKRATFSRWKPASGGGSQPSARAEIKLYDVRVDVLLPSAPLNPEPRNNLEVHDDDGVVADGERNQLSFSIAAARRAGHGILHYAFTDEPVVAGFTERTPLDRYHFYLSAENTPAR